jgi:hypothetical protein
MEYYTYAYLREDGTPYYIGKGKDDRVNKRSKKDIQPPEDKSRIIFLKKNLTEEEAFRHEIYMIAVFGRKDLGTGILRNMTDGGDGSSGRIISEEARKKRSEYFKGEKNPSKNTEVNKKRRQTLIGRKLSPEHCKNMGKSKKGVKWWNNGKETKFCMECPGEGWNIGRIITWQMKKKVI